METESPPLQFVQVMTPDPPAAADLDTVQAEKFSGYEWNIILYEDGDLTLIITGGFCSQAPEWDKDARAALTVCSSKLDKALPGWRDRITQIRSPEASGHLPMAELADGTPRAFEHLIAAAHFSPTEESTAFMIADYLSFSEVCCIAKLSHQYKALHLIAENVPYWIEKFFPRGWKLESPEEYCSQLYYLWVAYEFGLDKIFHHICFNLAYVTTIIFANPLSVPSGLYHRIYQCRREYSDLLLSDITDYHEKLLAATASGAEVGASICSHPSQSQAALCAAKQLRILDDWLETEGLAADLKEKYWNTLWMSDHRSPINYFHPAPSTRDLARYHKDDPYQEECGLINLAATIRDNGKMRLFQWMSESGTGSRMATAEHLAYMAEQRRKLSHIQAL